MGSPTPCNRQFFKCQRRAAFARRFYQVKIMIRRDAPTLLPRRNGLVWLTEIIGEVREARPYVKNVFHAVIMHTAYRKSMPFA